jgi:DNA-binding LytR/AlgR family response regulator
MPASPHRHVRDFPIVLKIKSEQIPQTCCSPLIATRSFLVAVRKESERSPIAGTESEENELATIHRDDFVLLTDDIKLSIVRTEDIYLLEAFRNFTLVHFSDGNLLIRRSLGSCERRLDGSIFFRANRGSIVNLTHVERPLLNKGRLVFVLKEGRKVVFSRRQSVLFRKTRGL